MFRKAHHHDSSGMSGILAPEARKPPPKNFHKENLQNMHQKDMEQQRKKEEEVKKASEPEAPFKMRRF